MLSSQTNLLYTLLVHHLSDMKKTVTIYTTPECQFSRELREFLHERAASFVEYNVIDEPDRLAEMRRLTGGATSVPVIVVNRMQPDQAVFIGFESVSLERALS